MNRLPDPITVERTFSNQPTDWQHIGRFHFAFFHGIVLGLRRYDQLLIGIETDAGENLDWKDFGEKVLDLLTTPQRSDQELGLLLCVEDTRKWTEVKDLFLNVIIIVDIAKIPDLRFFPSLESIRKAVIEATELSKLNPFSWQGSCRDNMFFGRKQAIIGILTQPHASFAVVGPRRVGKTSLLRRLRHEVARYPGQTYVYIDCSGISTFYELTQELLRRISPRQYLGWSGKTAIDQELISAASKLKSRYVIALDEFDGIAESSKKEFGRIKDWITYRFHGRFRFIVAGYDALWDRIEDRTSYLFNVFTPIVLGPFTRIEGEAFVLQTLGELEIPIVHSSEALSLLLDTSGLQPWLLQALCHKIVNSYSLDRSVYPHELVRRSAESYDIKQTVFQSTAMNCSPLGNAVLACIAAGQAQDELSLVEAFRQVGIDVATEKMIKELRFLCVTGALNHYDKGYRLSSELLGKHIRSFWSFEQSALVLKKRELSRKPKYHENSGGQNMNRITNINISHNQLGMLNIGEMKKVGSISNSISLLMDANNDGMAQALKVLTEAVANSTELSEQVRSETLEQLEEISRQATLPQDSRAPIGVIKALLFGIATTLSAAGGLAEVWSTWGHRIGVFFGP